ncbi:MAG: hypothetical protein LLG44_01135 [Chloroflexi bacterium]|nr:hypothetical protein [Chloroflexota bacterium]
MWLLSLLGILLFMSGCLPVLDRPREQPVDVNAHETQVSAYLSGTLTAKAPTLTPAPTNTPQPPTPVPSPTPTHMPYVTGEGPFLVFVRLMQEDTENIILRSGENAESVLTRFGGGHSISDLTWSTDGEWLVFPSAYNYLLSRNNERNIFVVRPDGTGLRMLTGEYQDPAQAEGPFITLSGAVTGAASECLVSAQGAAGPVTTTLEGRFELPGVPVSSAWVRAVCNQEDVPLQGDVAISLTEGTTTTVDIPVAASGQGWTSAALSPDGCILVGIIYQWSLSDQGERIITSTARLINLGADQITELTLPEGASISGLAWSPSGDQLVGTLDMGNSVSLWLWDSQGSSMGSLLDIPNPEDTIYTLNQPKWSYDGNKIAYTRQSYYWWSGSPQFKTEIDIIDVASKQVLTLVPGEFGSHAMHPSWSADGSSLYYQLTTGDAEADPAGLTGWQIWRVDSLSGASTQLTKDGDNILPAVRSNNRPRTNSQPGCLEP